MDTSDVLRLLNENYPVEFDRLEFFRNGGSLSYTVFANKIKYFLRIIKPAFYETALQSININLFLYKNGIPVPRIVSSRLMSPYIEADGKDGKYLYILYEFIDGKEPSMTSEAENVGILIGKCHKAMQKYKGKLITRDKYFFIDRYIDILRKMKYPESKVNNFEELGCQLWDTVKSLPQGFCHGDLYIGNIHQSRSGELFLIDFDTSCYAFPLYDIALVCNSTNYFNFDERGYFRTKRILERFLTGYNQFFNLSEFEKESVFILLGIYHYQLQATIIEINGLECVDEAFLDNQFDWLVKWTKQCRDNGLTHVGGL